MDPGETCEIAGVGPVSVSAVRSLLSDAFLTLVIRDGVDVRNVTHLGRQVTATQRTALEARGGACECCGSRYLLDIDHNEGWTRTHDTRLDDLSWLCWRCHDHKTRHDLRLEGPPNGRWLVDRETGERCNVREPSARSERHTTMRLLRFTAAALACVLLVAACGDGESTTTSAPAGIEPVADPTVERPPATSAHLDDLVAGLNGAGYELFLAATEGSDEDAVVSPLSIGLAFGMADVGATGDTADALADFFGLPATGEERWAAFNALDLEVTDVGEPIVRLANRQFPDVAFETVEGYDETLARSFGVAVEPLPLQAEPEASRQRINGFVAERTEDLIPELLPRGFVNPNTVLVLVNALYLEADWARPFGKYPTQDQPFTRLDGSTVTVPLMHDLELRGPAVATDTYAATELPYEGDELSMLVIVPEEGRFEEVQAKLGRGLVDEIDAAAGEGAVELFLPRFESDTNVDLRELMEAELGIADVFGVAGFGGIAEGITLERAVHAADIAVDEIGTVAAAATALGFDESGPGEPDVVVRADRPFLYLIRHQPTGAVLFVGRVLDPAA